MSWTELRWRLDMEWVAACERELSPPVKSTSIWNWNYCFNFSSAFSTIYFDIFLVIYQYCDVERKYRDNICPNFVSLKLKLIQTRFSVKVICYHFTSPASLSLCWAPPTLLLRYQVTKGGFSTMLVMTHFNTTALPSFTWISCPPRIFTWVKKGNFEC